MWSQRLLKLFPAGAARTVLDGDAVSGQLLPNGIRRREVAARPRRLALGQQLFDEGRDRRVLPLRRRNEVQDAVDESERVPRPLQRAVVLPLPIQL